MHKVSFIISAIPDNYHLILHTPNLLFRWTDTVINSYLMKYHISKVMNVMCDENRINKDLKCEDIHFLTTSKCFPSDKIDDLFLSKDRKQNTLIKKFNDSLLQ